MSYTLLSAKDRKAAKDYYCDWCSQMIVKGAVHNVRNGVCDGDFQTSRFHPECVKPCMDVCDKEGYFEPGEGKRPTEQQP